MFELSFYWVPILVLIDFQLDPNDFKSSNIHPKI